MEQRLSLVTLGVADLARAKAFYETLGWQAHPGDDDVVFFQAVGFVLALWGAGELAEDSAVTDSGGWGGVTLAQNVRSPAEVDAVLAQARPRVRGSAVPGARDVLGWLLRDLRRPRRSSLGGRPQPVLDDHRRRPDPAEDRGGLARAYRTRLPPTAVSTASASRPFIRFTERAVEPYSTVIAAPAWLALYQPVIVPWQLP